MQYIRDLAEYQDSRESVVTFGKFDGLHLGHQKLAGKVRELGREEGISSVLCSFDMRPLWESKDLKVKVLMTAAERKKHLENSIDYLVECPFTQEFGRICAEDFIRDIVRDCFHARYVVVGPDFRFGYQKRGDVRMLEQFARPCGYELLVMEKERLGQREISSTYIREVLQLGDAELAERLLGYAYAIQGTVERGKQIGRTLGFPTLNVAWPEEKIVPARGVYLSRVWLEGRWYPSVSNVGVKPTVSSEGRVLTESFLFDYTGNAYGKSVTVEFLKYRRPEQKFENIDDMKACVEQDIAYGRTYFI